MKFKFGIAFSALAVAGFAVLAVPAQKAKANGHECAIIAKVDRNKNGKIDLFEALRAGNKAFKSINDDGDWTLEPDEAAERHIGPRTFDKYNRIKRKGLDRVEWSRLVRDRFMAANGDRDRTLECGELKTRRGRRLLAVIWY